METNHFGCNSFKKDLTVFQTYQCFQGVKKQNIATNILNWMVLFSEISDI